MEKEKKKSIKEELDEIYGVTDEEIDGIILGQKIEDEEEKLKILKELTRYKSFRDYVNDHEKEFEMIDVGDDFKTIMISDDLYPNIDLDILKKIGVVVNHFGILVYTASLEDKGEVSKKSDGSRRKEKI